jgi:hypothetical protein
MKELTTQERESGMRVLQTYEKELIKFIQKMQKGDKVQEEMVWIASRNIMDIRQNLGIQPN